MITREQAALLAKLARTIRTEWDELTTITTIAELRDKPLTTIARTVIAAAQNPNNRTPKAILFQPEPTPTEPTNSPRHNETCPKDGHSGWVSNCAQCRSEQIAIQPD